MTGANELTSPAPRVMIKSPGLAIETTLSTALTIDGSNPECSLSISFVIIWDVTPGIGSSLAGYISKTKTSSAIESASANSEANAWVLEYLWG